MPMTKTEKAITQMEEWARDDSHGYDQRYRWGEYRDFDCSSSVIQSWENAGVPVKSNGATYTGNMYTVFIRTGFKDVTDQIDLSTGAGLKRGDILLNVRSHVAMYCGNGQEVEASINENGDVVGGQPGDQTGYEFLIRPYRNYPWDRILRWPEEEKQESSDYDMVLPQIKIGDTGKYVKAMQKQLRVRGFIDRQTGLKIEADSVFGPASERALIYFQETMGLEPDGVCGPATWPVLFYLY